MVREGGLRTRALSVSLTGGAEGLGQGGIDYLLQKRKQDPYADFVKRMAYEALWGGSKRAPTFDP
jgi:hypothetical protein